MQKHILNPMIKNYPAPIYTVFLAFKNHPICHISNYLEEGVIVQSWAEANKALALFIDQLNQYYLDHQNYDKTSLMQPANN